MLQFSDVTFFFHRSRQMYLDMVRTFKANPQAIPNSGFLKYLIAEKFADRALDIADAVWRVLPDAPNSGYSWLIVCGHTFILSAEKGLFNDALEFYGTFNMVHLVILRVKCSPETQECSFKKPVFPKLEGKPENKIEK